MGIAGRQRQAYVVTLIDLHSRALVSWAATDHMRTSLITDALDMGIPFQPGRDRIDPEPHFSSSMIFTINVEGGQASPRNASTF